MLLENKNAIIYGAGGGIGGGVARAFAREGAKVFLVGRTQQSLESVAAEAERQGLLLESLWARLDLGTLLSSVNPDRAAQILREAGADAERMKATTEMRLADKGLRSLGVRTWRRGGSARGAGAVGELSEREREIARRVASGATNPEIAAALFLSRKTVERHVSNVYDKLGASGKAARAAAASYAIALGLA